MDLSWPDITGAVLAGGRSSRMGGENKALMTVNGSSMIDRILTVFSRIFGHVMIVTNDPRDCLCFDALIATDLFPDRCSLAGIHSALFHSPTPRVFVSACDTPFVDPAVIGHIISRAHDRAGIVIPQMALGLEPMCALYDRRSLKPIERGMRRGDRKVRGFFSETQVVYVPEAELRAVDPELKSLFNVNTPEDLERARAVTADGCQPDAVS